MIILYKPHSDFNPRRDVTREQLLTIMEAPALDLSGISYPIMIKSVELFFNYGQFYVKTTAGDGSFGLSIPNSWMATTYPIFNEQIVPVFLDKDARDIENLVEAAYRANYKWAGIPLFTSIAALELSVLDLLGKHAQKPIGALFGPKINDHIDIYVASGNRGTTPQEELEILEGRVRKHGARAIKFKIGGRMSKNADSIEGRSEGLIALTRKHFGDGMIIHADGNGSYDSAEAIRYGKMLEDINAYFYEEPCPFDDLWQTRDTAQALDIPLAFGEQETSMTRFLWIVQNAAAHVLQPDLLYCGGMIRATKAARMADAAGMTVTPHYSSGFPLVYTLHFASYTPNLGKYQEYKSGFESLNEVMGGCLTLKDGRCNIPEKPGAGIDTAHPMFKNARRVR